MIKNRLKLSLGLTFALALFGFAGCSAADEVSDSIDCSSVCHRYSDCFDADYDTDGCSDRCESDASNNEDRQRRLHLCDDCINERSCTGATFNCADDCVGIVP